jgi:hypothetical protein
MTEETVPETPLPARRDVVCNGVSLSYLTDLSYTGLTEQNRPPTVFQRGGSLVRIKYSPEKVYIENYDKDSFKNKIDTVCNFYTRSFIEDEETGEREEILTPKFPPNDVVSGILKKQNFDEIPEIVTVTGCPIMNNDGSITLTEGYDHCSQSYYRPIDDLEIPDIPEHPTAEDVTAAVQLINETICDFPFVVGGNRTNMIATIITAVIRPMIPGSVPICLIDKPQAGTGAGLLSDTISLIVTGRRATIRVAPKDDDEWRKLITSILSEGWLLSVIDNIEGKVNLASLAGVVTSGIWSDRKLGTNTTITYPHRIQWILNGNNVRLGGDIPRRCIWVRMNANVQCPWLRPESIFTHPDQLSWVAENRGYILSAIFTLVRAWIHAGKPQPISTVPRMGGFEDYRNIVGGILQNAGYIDFLANANDLLEEVDDDAPEWNEFFQMVYTTFSDPKNQGYAIFTTTDIVNNLEIEEKWSNRSSQNPLLESLPPYLKDAFIGKKNFANKLGHALKKNKDRVFENNLTLTISQNRNHNKLHWELKYSE